MSATRPARGLASRIARRNARRSRGRSALIVLMMMVPVLAMSAIVTVAASMVPTDDELVTMTLGQTQAIVRVAASPGQGLEQSAGAPVRGYWDIPRDETGQPVREASGEYVNPAEVIDARVIGVTNNPVTVQTPNGVRSVSATAGDVLQPVFEGRWALLGGRAPQNDREASITMSLREILDVEIGETIRVVAPERTALTVVGIHESELDRDSLASMVVRDGAIGLPTAAESLQTAEFFVLGDELVTWDQVSALNERGLVVGSREVILGGDPTPGAIPEEPFAQSGIVAAVAGLVALVGGFFLFQVILLSAAAFMVGARQQQRSMAIMASVGAEASTLRASVSRAGVTLGALAAVLGVGLGIGTGWIAVQVLDDGSARSWPGFHVEPLPLVAVGLLAVLAGWIAAMIPARIAARIDIVTSLRGARRPAAPRRGRSVAAIIVLLTGVAAGIAGGILLAIVASAEVQQPTMSLVATLLIVVGAIAAQLGVLLALPAILGALAAASRGARTAVRLAVRDAARNSGRTVPVVAALMTTVFLSSFLMTVFGAQQQVSESFYQFQSPLNSVLVSTRTSDPVTQRVLQVEDPEVLAQELSGALDGAEVTTISGVQEMFDTTWDQLTGEPTILDESLVPTVAVLNESCTALWFSGDEDARDDLTCDERDATYLFSTYTFLGDRIRVGTVAELELATGMTLTAESRRVLERGGAVALFDDYVADGEVRIDWREPSEILMPSSSTGEVPVVRSDRLSAVVQRPPVPVVAGILLLPNTARQLGLEVEPLAVMAQLDEAPTFAQSDAVRAISFNRTGEEWGIPTHIETGPPDAVGPAAWALLGISGAIALTASSVAVGLSRIDGRRDSAILGAVGATPRLRRSIGFWQVLVLAGVGSVIGSLLGVAAAGALALPGGPLPFAPPWLQLVLSTIAVPLVIAVGAWMFPGRQTTLPTDRSAIG